jgi:hypothetical protein
MRKFFVAKLLSIKSTVFNIDRTDFGKIGGDQRNHLSAMKVQRQEIFNF